MIITEFYSSASFQTKRVKIITTFNSFLSAMLFATKNNISQKLYDRASVQHTYLYTIRYRLLNEYMIMLKC